MSPNPSTTRQCCLHNAVHTTTCPCSPLPCSELCETGVPTASNLREMEIEDKVEAGVVFPAFIVLLWKVRSWCAPCVRFSCCLLPLRRHVAQHGPLGHACERGHGNHHGAILLGRVPGDLGHRPHRLGPGKVRPTFAVPRRATSPRLLFISTIMTHFYLWNVATYSLFQPSLFKVSTRSPDRLQAH